MRSSARACSNDLEEWDPDIRGGFLEMGLRVGTFGFSEGGAEDGDGYELVPSYCQRQLVYSDLLIRGRWFWTFW